MNEEEQEQKLQRAFKAITSKLEIALDRNNLIVVDLSAFPHFSSMFRSFDEELCSEYDRGLYEWWKDNSNGHIVYSKETNEEFLAYIDHLREKSDLHEKNAQNISGFARIASLNKAKATNRIAMSALELLENFIYPFQAEEYIPAFIGADFERQKLKSIYDAVKEIAEIPGIIIDTSPRYATRHSKNSFNSKNDSRILSKVLAISYEQPVSLVTKDADFQRMFLELIRNMGHYGRKYDFDIPFGEVELLKLHRKGLTRYDIKGKKRELSNLVDCDLEDIAPKNVL